MGDSQGRQIVVEGPIAVGKSTLAKKLAEHFAAALYLEAPHENPYLPAYYNDPERFALPTQLFFLLQRLQQRHDFSLLNNPGDNVWDYFLDKDLLFAKLSLNARDMTVYQSVYTRLTDPMARPDVVVYLTASPSVLMSRLRRRARDYESAVDEHYLASLAQQYEEYFDDYRAAPVLRIDTEDLDLARDETAVTELINKLTDMGMCSSSSSAHSNDQK